MKRINEMVDLTPPRVLREDKPIDWTMYGRDIKPSELVDNFEVIHYKWKYRFIMPVIKISKWILKSKLKKHIPSEPYNRALQTFDKAYEKALRKWYNLYIVKNAEAQYLADNLLRDLKHLLYTMILNDTAYREFINMLMFEIAIETNKEFGECANHLIYKNKAIIDVGYYAAYQGLQKGEIQLLQLPERYYIGKEIIVNGKKYELTTDKTRMCINGNYYRRIKEDEK